MIQNSEMKQEKFNKLSLFMTLMKLVSTEYNASSFRSLVITFTYHIRQVVFNTTLVIKGQLADFCQIRVIINLNASQGNVFVLET